MAGRPSLIRNVQLELKLPEDLYAKLVLELFSPSQGRVPKGMFSRFFTERLLEYYASKEPSNDDSRTD